MFVICCGAMTALNCIYPLYKANYRKYWILASVMCHHGCWQSTQHQPTRQGHCRQRSSQDPGTLAGSDASILTNVTKLWRAFFAYGSIGSYTGELSPPSSHQYYWRMCDANPSIWCRKLGWILLGRTWKESSKAVKVCCKWGSPPCFTLTHYEGKNLVPCAESWVSRDKLELKEYPICQHLTFPCHRAYTERVPHPAVPQVGNLPWHKLLHAHLWSHP